MRKLAALLVSERTDDSAQRCALGAVRARAWEDKPAGRRRESDCLTVCLAAGACLRARGPAVERRYPHDVDSPQV